MKRPTFFFLVLAVICAGTSMAQWTENGKPAPDVQWRQSSNGFGVLLGITDHPSQFEENWSRPGRAVPVSMPATIKRNEPARLFVIFTGCPENADGKCDVVADLQLLKPDGSIYGELKDTDFWIDKPGPEPGEIERAHTGIGFRIEASDPSGEYTVKVHVHDRIAGIEFHLERRFAVE
jgi:hypothetical protein